MSSLAQTAYELLGQQSGGLRFVFDELPVGVILIDKDETLVMCNHEAERIFGPRPAAVSPVEWCWGRKIYRPNKKTPFSPSEVPLARALRGEEVSKELMFVEKDTPAGGLWIRANSRPLRNADGSVCGAVAVFFDVTDFRLAAERANLLSLAVEQTADSIVITDTSGIIQYINPAFETTTGYSRQEAVGRTPAFLKSGRHDTAFYADMWGQILGGETFRGTLVNRKKSGELYYAEQTIAAIRNNEGEMTHFVSVLKDVTALRKQQEQTIQLDLAREVQQRFNASAASIPGLELGAATLPAQETGGDYYDSIPTSDDSVTIAIGDVSGHGINAALGMASTRAYVRSACDHRLDIAATLASINNMLFTDLAGDHFVTLILAHIDTTTRTLTYASAGHVPALLIDVTGSVERLDSTGIPLGLFKHRTFTSGTIPIQNGHMLVMVTDGVTESAMESGSDWIVDYLRHHRSASAQQIADGICHAALALAGNNPQQDDITALVVRVAEQ